jgi:hypothetical protein
MYWRQRGPFPAGGETENGLRRRNLHHQGIVGTFARSSGDNLPSPAAGTSAGLSGRRRLALQSRRDRAMGTTTGSGTPATSRSRTASARRVGPDWVDRPALGRTRLAMTSASTVLRSYRSSPSSFSIPPALLAPAFPLGLADEVADLGGEAFAFGHAHARRIPGDLLSRLFHFLAQQEETRNVRACVMRGGSKAKTVGEVDVRTHARTWVRANARA